MLHLGAAREWDPPVLSTSAVDAEGIESLWEAIEAHRTHVGSTGALAHKRRTRLLREVEALAAERFRRRVAAIVERDPAVADDLVNRRVDPYEAAAMLVDRAAR
jgi:LAO/AO transport system kinase